MLHSRRARYQSASMTAEAEAKSTRRPPRTTTLAQDIARLERKLATAKTRAGKLERNRDTRALIVAGGALLALARTAPNVADWVRGQLLPTVTRDQDQEAAVRFLAMLDTPND